MASDESYTLSPSPSAGSAAISTVNQITVPSIQNATDQKQATNSNKYDLTRTKTFSASQSPTAKSRQHRLGVSSTGRTAIVKPDSRSNAKIGWSGEGFGGYMREKERKLREQFDAEAIPASQSTLFAAVTVWVTGATKPSRTELRRLLAAHGGKFETYLSRERVTHIVADNLATATRRRLASAPGKPSPYTIVKAAWIPDSITAGKLLPPMQYAVVGMTDPSQRAVSGFFRPRSRGTAPSQRPR